MRRGICRYTTSDGSHFELVRFNDLNLDQPRDVARLDRVSSAADKVCGTRSFAAHYNKMAEYEICYKDTVASAVATSNGHRSRLTSSSEALTWHCVSSWLSNNVTLPQ